jgi:hypothetical protein
MTQVRFRPKRADGANAEGVLLSDFVVVAEPDRRSDMASGELMPVALTILVNGAEVTRTLPANTLPQWVWRFTERFADGHGGAIEIVSCRNVPASGSVLDFESLTVVDPKTLDPLADPEAAWWTALNDAILGGGGAGGPITASQITDSTTVGRAVITAGTAAIARTAIAAAAAAHTHPVGDLTATGFPSNTTFLRGDNTWNVPTTANVAWDSITGKPTVYTPAAGWTQAVIVQSGGSYPTPLPTGFASIEFRGALDPATQFSMLNGYKWVQVT